MVATVPTSDRSSARGFSASALRWNTTPIERRSLAADCAAAIEPSRPSAIGRIMPGKSTILRTGTMISASSGIASCGCADGAASPAGSLALGSRLSRSRAMSGEPAQCDRQAAVRKETIGELILPGRKRDAPLEASVGDLQPVNDRAPLLQREGALAADHHRSRLERDLDRVRRDAGQRDLERQPVPGLVQVDRRLPGRRLGGAELEEMALDLPRFAEQLQSLGPYPSRIAVCHRLPQMGTRAGGTTPADLRSTEPVLWHRSAFARDIREA